MTIYEKHVALLTRIGEGRISRAKARIRKHSRAVDGARNAHDRFLAKERLRRAGNRLEFYVKELAEDIQAFTRYYEKAYKPALPPLPY